MDGRATRGSDDSGDSRIVTIHDVVSPINDAAIVETVTRWVEEVALRCPILLCVDAPLGWPAALGRALVDHRAGSALVGDADSLFRRATDRDIRRRVGKTPLDVGADRIARTASAVLWRVEELRRHVRREIRLALDIEAVRAIRDPADIRDAGPANVKLPIWLVESYPAAWFASERIDTRGYRPRDAHERRHDLFRAVLTRLTRSEPREWRAKAIDRVPEEEVVRTADTLDAVVCVYNGADVWCCDLPEPTDREAARIEGWIWCKSPM